MADWVTEIDARYQPGTPVDDRQVHADVRRLLDEVYRVRVAYGTTCHEVEQILGKALGYPAYGPEMFPDGQPNGDVCVGDHVPESVAAEAAEKIASLQRRTHVTVHPVQEGAWWVLYVDGHGATQVTDPDEAPRMVQDYVSLQRDVPADTIDVTIYWPTP